MISPRLKLIDLNPDHWARLMDLMLPPTGGDPEPAAAGPLGFLARAQAQVQAAGKPERSSLATSPHRPAVVLHRGGTILRVVQLGGGVLSSEGLGSVSTVDLRAYRKARALPLLVAIDVARLPEVWASFQDGINLTDDLALQHYAMLKALKAAIGSGVEVEPRLFGAVPLPAEAMLQKTFDRLLPDRRSFVMYLVDRGSVWTSVIATKRDGDLQLITTHGQGGGPALRAGAHRALPAAVGVPGAGRRGPVGHRPGHGCPQGRGGPGPGLAAGPGGGRRRSRGGHTHGTTRQRPPTRLKALAGARAGPRRKSR